MLPSRAGKTLTVFALWSYLQCCRPRDAIIVLPSQHMGNRIIEQKLHPLVLGSECFRDEIVSKRKVTADEIILRRSRTWLIGAGNPNQIASVSAGVGYVDETDAIYVSEDGNDIVELTRQRLVEYQDGLLLVSSTPSTDEGVIAQQYERSSQGRYYTQCPGCRGWHVWCSLREEGDHEAQLDWGYYPGTKLVDPEQVQITCACGYGVRQHERAALLRGGEWRHADAGEDEPRSNRGFHLHRLQTLDLDWSETARAQRAAVKTDIGKLRVFLNHYAARPFQKRRIVQDDAIAALREHVERVTQLPDDLEALFIGVDTQKSYYVYTVVALHADGSLTVLAVDRAETDHELERVWQAEHLGRLADCVIVDAGDGHRMHDVLELVERLGKGAFAYMGARSQKRWTWSTRYGQTIVADAVTYGEELYQRLHGFQPGEPGYVTLSSTIHDDWLRQLADVQQEKRGATVKLVDSGNNHGFDALKMATVLTDVWRARQRTARPGKPAAKKPRGNDVNAAVAAEYL